MEKEEDLFEKDPIFHFKNIPTEYYYKICDYDPERNPEKMELYNMMQFAYLYMEDDKRREEYERTHRLILKDLDDSVNDWKEYFETKFETAMNEMTERVKKDFVGSYFEAEFVYNIFPCLMGNFGKLFDNVPFAKVDVETEERFHEIIDSANTDGCYSYDDIPQFWAYSNNREKRRKTLFKKAEKERKEREEDNARFPPKKVNYLHLVDYVEKLNQYEVPKPILPKPKPAVQPVTKPTAKPALKSALKAALKPISVAKKVNIKEKVKASGKENKKPKVKVSKILKTPVKATKEAKTVA